MLYIKWQNVIGLAAACQMYQTDTIKKWAYWPSCCRDDPSFTRFSRMLEAQCCTLSMWCSRCVHTNSSMLSTTETSRICTAVVNRLRDRRRKARLMPNTIPQSAFVLYWNKYTFRKNIHSLTYWRCEDCCNMFCKSTVLRKFKKSKKRKT